MKSFLANINIFQEGISYFVTVWLCQHQTAIMQIQHCNDDGALCTVHCTQYALCTVYCALYSALCILCTLYSVWTTLWYLGRDSNGSPACCQYSIRHTIKHHQGFEPPEKKQGHQESYEITNYCFLVLIGKIFPENLV